jgi:hypothetical protein
MHPVCSTSKHPPTQMFRILEILNLKMKFFYNHFFIIILVSQSSVLAFPALGVWVGMDRRDGRRFLTKSLKACTIWKELMENHLGHKRRFISSFVSFRSGSNKIKMEVRRSSDKQFSTRQRGVSWLDGIGFDQKLKKFGCMKSNSWQKRR